MQPTVLSEVGRRENNEDAAFASPRLVAVAVADGVGGAAAGEIASRLAILKMIGLDKRRLVASLEQELGDAVADANRLLLCSDDITDYMADQLVAKLLRISDPQVALRRLVDTALEHGSRENVTAVIADIVIGRKPPSGWLIAAPGSGTTE